VSGHPVLVPDTSVLLKWVLESADEGDRDHALELRGLWLAGRCSIVLPSLWFFEVGNILGIREPELAAQFMQILTGYRFEEESPPSVFKKTFELMKRFKVTFYDAAYHATAMNRSGTMITADRAYYKKTSAAGHVDLLANWSSTKFDLPAAKPS
jgi:predicted nucleic acid-binding protein